MVIRFAELALGELFGLRPESQWPRTNGLDPMTEHDDHLQLDQRGKVALSRALMAIRTTHGRFAKEKRAEAKWRAEIGRRPNIPLNRTVHKKSIALTRSAIVWDGTTGLVSKEGPSI